MSHQPDNIFAGTQVVALVEVRGTNNSLVHPRGAVGVVTRTPTGTEQHFLVRFRMDLKPRLPAISSRCSSISRIGWGRAAGRRVRRRSRVVIGSISKRL